MEGVCLPPEPVITQWGTWIKAAIFYAEKFEAIKELILNLEDNSQCVVQSKELLKNPLVPKQLVFIKWMYIAIIPYGATTWSTRTSLASTKANNISKVQRPAYVCITGVMRTCLSAAIYVILKRTPLQLMIEIVAKRTRYKMIRNGVIKRKSTSFRTKEKEMELEVYGPRTRNFENTQSITGYALQQGSLPGIANSMATLVNCECRFCEDKTSIHVLTECVALQNKRELYLGYQIEEGDLPNLKPLQILHFF
ncbi:unnamed protein product [Psylliodes chrysocephalus]|uniref:Uncharacterized protein n=1 Tax=Psylliodes chrysocephalus TaxID=3402493 RepID=A0A9P0CK46_9CUCU|nr:unnamed protein product [Psylliodes chrysocephala]